MSTESTEDCIKAKVIGQTFVNICRVNSDIAWEQPVYAINWFDARFLPIYNFYNTVASRSVKKVGGVPLFKGRYISKVHGSDEDGRQVILLVRYPSPDNFRRMVANTYFKVVSIIRTLVVDRFTFCLSHIAVEVDIPKELDGVQNYAVHHFRGNRETVDLISASLKQQGIEIAFGSLKTHQLFSVSGDSKPVPVPVVMDGIVLFKCEDIAALEKIIGSNSYQQCLQQSESSFIGMYERIM